MSEIENHDVLGKIEMLLLDLCLLNESTDLETFVYRGNLRYFFANKYSTDWKSREVCDEASTNTL